MDKRPQRTKKVRTTPVLAVASSTEFIALQPLSSCSDKVQGLGHNLGVIRPMVAGEPSFPSVHAAWKTAPAPKGWEKVFGLLPSCHPLRRAKAAVSGG